MLLLLFFSDIGCVAFTCGLKKKKNPKELRPGLHVEGLIWSRGNEESLSWVVTVVTTVRKLELSSYKPKVL